MKQAAYTSLLLLLIGGGALLLGRWSVQKAAPKDPLADRTVRYYVDPMHPAYQADKPGTAPDCGMELVPVYADGSLGGTGGAAGGLPGTVTVSAETQQVLGVRVAPAQPSPSTHTLRMLGRVVPDETRLYRINAATDGWIRKILPITTDSPVHADELLATFYAPEFFSAMKAYLYGLRSLERFEKSGRETKEQLELTGATLEGYRNALRNLGMSEHQLDEIQRTREGGDQVEIRAPAAGFLLARNVTLGERFQRGTELYRIADLSRVWIMVDAYESEASSLKAGMQVRIFAPHLHKAFLARAAHVPPKFDPTSRTLQVRLEAENPGSLLRPGMFVDLEVPVSRPAAIVVPVDAVVDSGRKQTVYVAKGDGAFEPRRVETGWRAGDQVEIVKGLMAGERIVVSGTFLIDSESRMKAAAAGITGESSQDPVCGMEVDQGKAKAAGRMSAFNGQTYYFCSDDCKVNFDKDPTRYLKKAGQGGSTEAGTTARKVNWDTPKPAPPVPSDHMHDATAPHGQHSHQ